MELGTIEKVSSECGRFRNNQPCGTTSHGALLKACTLVWVPDGIKRALRGNCEMLPTLTCLAWTCDSLELVAMWYAHITEFSVSSEKNNIANPVSLQDRILRFVINPKSVTSFTSMVVSLFLQRHWLADLSVSWTQTWVLLGSKDSSCGCWQESWDMVNLHAFPVSLSQPAGRPFEDKNSILNLFKCKFSCINS